VEQVYPGLDARPSFTVLSKLRQRRRNGGGAFVHLQLSDDVRTFLEEPRFAVLATLDVNGRSQQTIVC
jgi:hypothetical protein